MTSDELERVVLRLPARVRKRRGNLSLRDAELQAGVSFMTIARVERGEPPALDTLLKLLDWVEK